MQIGDLVKVYDFSHRAREHYKADARSTPDDIDGHNVGLIVSDTTMYRNWYIQLCEHNITEIYQEDRLEIINEGR